MGCLAVVMSIVAVLGLAIDAEACTAVLVRKGISQFCVGFPRFLPLQGNGILSIIRT